MLVHCIILAVHDLGKPKEAAQGSFPMLVLIHVHCIILHSKSDWASALKGASAAGLANNSANNS